MLHESGNSKIAGRVGTFYLGSLLLLNTQTQKKGQRAHCLNIQPAEFTNLKGIKPKLCEGLIDSSFYRKTLAKNLCERIYHVA